MKGRLDKVLATLALISRTDAQSAMKAGRVTVDGKPEKDNSRKIDPAIHTVCLDGEPLGGNRRIVLMLNKPEGYVSATEDSRLPVVTELLDDELRRMELFPVGRLDRDTVGLMILTNNGQLAHSLMHPSHEVYKEYLVKLTPDEEGLPSPEKPLSGVIELDGERLLPAKCRLLTKTENGYVMTIAIRQGKNRQIRRMCAKCGYTVNSLKRVSEGDVKLADLPSGRWRYFTDAEVRYLKSL